MILNKIAYQQVNAFSLTATKTLLNSMDTIVLAKCELDTCSAAFEKAKTRSVKREVYFSRPLIHNPSELAKSLCVSSVPFFSVTSQCGLLYLLQVVLQ